MKTPLRTTHITPPAAPSDGSQMTLLRGLGVVAFASVAVIHLVQLVPTFRATPLLGVAFVGIVAASSVFAVRLAVGRHTPSEWLLVAGFAASAIIGYVVTRTVRTPLDNQDVGNWACMLGMAALYLEGMLGVLGLYASSPRRRPEAQRSRLLPVYVADTDELHEQVNFGYRDN